MRVSHRPRNEESHGGGDGDSVALRLALCARLCNTLHSRFDVTSVGARFIAPKILHKGFIACLKIYVSIQVKVHNATPQ